MITSELILILKKLMDEHGDLEVVAYADHDRVQDVIYSPMSWINDNQPAFEIEG